MNTDCGENSPFTSSAEFETAAEFPQTRLIRGCGRQTIVSFVFINVPFSRQLTARTMENICIIIHLLIPTMPLALCAMRCTLLIYLLSFSLARRICSLQSVCATITHNDSIYNRFVSIKPFFSFGKERGLLSPPMASTYRRSCEFMFFFCVDWLAHPFSSFCVFRLIWEIWWSSLAFFLAPSLWLSLALSSSARISSRGRRYATVSSSLCSRHNVTLFIWVNRAGSELQRVVGRGVKWKHV